MTLAIMILLVIYASLVLANLAKILFQLFSQALKSLSSFLRLLLIDLSDLMQNIPDIFLNMVNALIKPVAFLLRYYKRRQKEKYAALEKQKWQKEQALANVLKEQAIWKKKEMELEIPAFIRKNNHIIW